MKVDTSSIKTEGDLGGVKIGMTLDQDSLVHIIGSIASLYSDIIVSIVRELSTNAIDSHLEAGVDKAIEILTPNDLSPQLVVRDFGTGMSREDIENIWSKVGYSTKRDSNLTTGRFGYGRISPLAYGSQSMTVVTVKDGRKTSFIVGSDVTSGGLIEILDVSETDEPNGYVVKIPVGNTYDHYKFARAAKHFATFSSFPVKVDGELINVTPKRSFANFDIYDRYKLDVYESSFVLQGNIAYPLDGPHFSCEYNEAVVVRVKMGEVDFTPSREALKMTNKTNKTIETYKSIYYQTQIDYFQDRIDKVQSRTDAIFIHREAIKFLDRRSLNRQFYFSGEVIPEKFNLEARRVTWEGEDFVNVSRQSAVRLDVTGAALVLLGFEKKAFTRVDTAKVQAYCAANNIPLGSFYVVESHEDNLQWFDRTTFIQWSDVKDVKVDLKPLGVRVKGAKDKPAPVFYGIGGVHDKLKHFTPDVSKDIYYIGKAEAMGSATMFSLSHLNNMWSKDRQIFLIPLGEQPGFVKLFPKAKHLSNIYEDDVKAKIADFTDEEIRSIQLGGHISNLSSISESQIDDPDLRECIREYYSADLCAAREKREVVRKLIRKLPNDIQQKYINQLPQTDDTRVAELRNKYPLMRSFFSYGNYDAREHLVKYINAVYNGTL